MLRILITGATSGIGLELAQQYASRGHQLILVGRRDIDTLDSDFFTTERYCQADLAQAEAADIIAEFLNQQDIPMLDLLIHNAGVGYYGDIATQSVENIETLVAVNLTAPVLISHRLLPYLHAKHSKIVLISSVVADLPAPDYAVYAATKAALDEFAYNLRIELDEDHIGVQVIHPGATRTEMHQKSGITPDVMNTSKFPSAESVAADIIAAIDSDKAQTTIGTPNKVMRFVGKHLDGLVDTAMKR